MSRGRTGGKLQDKGGNEDRIKLVEEVCRLIKENPAERLSLSDLESRFGVSRYTIQRDFKEVMGISPRKYVEEVRISLLKRNLREGVPVPEAIYRTGYNSQSWLYEKSGTILGMSPASYRRGGEGTTIRYCTGESGIGTLIVAETDHGICTVSIGEDSDELASWLGREFPKAVLEESESVRDTLDGVRRYLEGQEVNFRFDIAGTDFQRKVWSTLQTIPYGETRSYNEIAERIGKPNAYRAVANACAANPVPLVVPCHRVVRKDGSLGGYALGVERKQALLELEGKKAGKVS